MKKDSNVLVTSALLGLMAFHGELMADSKPIHQAHKEVADSVMCYGVNSCKGAGACAGKIDSCSGRDGCQSELKCAGHNSCKGKGLLKLSKKECLEKGGSVAK